jgi:hypothetical protein
MKRGERVYKFITNVYDNNFDFYVNKLEKQSTFTSTAFIILYEI